MLKSIQNTEKSGRDHEAFLKIRDYLIKEKGEFISPICRVWEAG